MHKVKINEDFVFDIEHKGAELFVDGLPTDIDIANIEQNSAHVLYNNKSYNTEVIEIDRAEKLCRIKVNSTIYNVKLEDQFDQLLKQLGMDNLTSAKVLELKAPMPGLVLNVLVAENDEIKKGDNLLILEAMKMENILKSTTDGIVKKILINTGDKVDKNQILIVFK
jgi:biotin carboxyl carrier protein